MSPEEYMNRMHMKQNMPQQQPIVNVASPEAVTKESFLASAPNYRDLSFIKQPKPEPSALQQAGSYVAESALGKATDAGWDKGSQMFADKVATPIKTWWGSLANPAAASGAGHSLASGAGAAAAGNVAGATGAATPGIMAKLGAAAGGAGSGLAAMAGPIGIGLLGAKMLGLFNRGGAVHANMGGLLSMDMGKFKGPLSGLLPQYHERGDEVEVPMPRPRYLMYPYQSNIEPPMSRPRPMTYGEAYNKAYDKYGFDHMEPESEWGKSLYHGFNKAFSPSIALDAKLMQMQYNKEMRDAGVPGFNQGGNVQHKEHGGIAGPLSNNKSVKMEKKETVEYKN